MNRNASRIVDTQFTVGVIAVSAAAILAAWLPFYALLIFIGGVVMLWAALFEERFFANTGDKSIPLQKPRG